MKIRFLVGSVLAVFLLAVGSVWAQSVDEKIQVLEQELSQLKTQQMELRKEATAAAEKLPTFRYRPGNGLAITAADKSWELRWYAEFHMHVYNHPDGVSSPNGKNSGPGDPSDTFSSDDLFLRRNRTYINYCWLDCFYLMRFGIDADTGESLGTQTADFYINYSNLNPYFPDFILANPGGQSMRYVSRSSERSAQVEIAADMEADSMAHNLGTRQVGLQWNNVPVGQGDATLVLAAVKPFFSSAGFNTVLGGGANRVPSGSNENADNTDLWSFFLKAGSRPFNKSKNKWLEKIKLGFGYEVNALSLDQSATQRRIRLRTMDRVGRVTLMDIRGIGKGIHNRFEWGFEWGVGPYLFRNENGLSTFEDKAGVCGGSCLTSHKGVRGRFFSLGNELFLWSPKGFLTGSGTTPKSLQIGWRFARSEAHCGVVGCANGVSFSRAHLSLRELDLWYYIRPGMSIGTWWNWWHSSNTPQEYQELTGCKKNPTDDGKSCTWHSVNLGLRLNF